MTETHTQLEPTFSIVAQGIRDLSFENQIGFGTNISEQPEINININANGKKIDDETYEVMLMINVEAKQEDKPLILIELQYVGLCQIENVPDEMLAGLLMIQTPTLLFPYARQILSDVTSNAGFPPLFLQPVDFAALYHNQQANVGVVGNA